MRVHHVALRTHDPARLARWYAALFDLAVRREQPGYSVWLDLDGATLMIERAAPSEPAIPAGAMDFFALAVTADGRDAFLDRCAAEGVSVEHRTEFTVYVRDPDGRRVGVSCFAAFPSNPVLE